MDNYVDNWYNKKMKNWHEDVRLINELDTLRQRKLGFMEKCYFCSKDSQGIKAIDQRLYAVCSNHIDGKDVNSLLEYQTSFEE